jgi:hypothetical protein
MLKLPTVPELKGFRLLMKSVIWSVNILSIIVGEYARNRYKLTLIENKKACKSMIYRLSMCPEQESLSFNYQLITRKVCQYFVKKCGINFVHLIPHSSCRGKCIKIRLIKNQQSFVIIEQLRDLNRVC